MFGRFYQQGQALAGAIKLVTAVPPTAIANINKVSSALPVLGSCNVLQSRFNNVYLIDQPKPNDRKYNYNYLVKYPKDGKYTIEHLPIYKLHGRNPITGKKVEKARRGGRETMFRWLDLNRRGPTGKNEFKEEQVIEVQYDPNRSAFIALVGTGANLRYVLATTDMRLGGIIRSSSYLPDIPARGKPGDSYPIGALPVGTQVCHVEKFPGKDGKLLMVSGTRGTIKRRLTNGKIVLELPSKHEIALDPHCNAVCGQVSNPDHSLIHIASPNRLRWLGYAPGSGLFQRKDGYCGKKIRRPPPLRTITERKPDRQFVKLECKGEGPRTRVVPKTNRKRGA